MVVEQVFEVVVHAPHVGPGHDDVRVSVMEPVCPEGHARVWVSGERGVQLVVTEQDACVYEPERDPLVHVRVCEMHEFPVVTVEDWYAVTDVPLWIVVPHGEVHECG